MKRFLLGLFSVGAIALALPVQAQEYGQLPDNCTNPVYSYCYHAPTGGDRVIYTVPSLYGESYILAVQPFDIHNFFVLVNRTTEQPVAWILVSDQGRLVRYYEGEEAFGGDIGLMREFVPEILDMLSVLPW